jgi:hypothetical protein
MEAYGKFRKSTETIILALLQLFDNTKDYGLLWEADGLRGWWGNPLGFESPLRHHSNN